MSAGSLSPFASEGAQTGNTRCSSNSSASTPGHSPRQCGCRYRCPRRRDRQALRLHPSSATNVRVYSGKPVKTGTRKRAAKTGATETVSWLSSSGRAIATCIGKRLEALPQILKQRDCVRHRDQASRGSLKDRAAKLRFCLDDLLTDSATRYAELFAAACSEPRRATLSSARRPFR